MIETTLGIDRMMCSMCEAHVNDAIRRNFDVASAKSDRRKGRCVVVSEEPLDEGRVRSVLSETGYDLVSLETAPARRRGLFGRFF